MRSMTGYGSARSEVGAWRWSVEVRSVNHRFLELRLNLPRDLARWETELRKAVQTHAARGKVDVNITVTGRSPAAVRVAVNLPLARAYLAAWRELQERLSVPGTVDLRMLAERGELFAVSEQQRGSEQDFETLRNVVERALRNWNREREREGRALKRDMESRLRELERLRRAIAQRVAKLKPQLFARLRERMQNLLQERQIDESRLLQEAALLAERSDVSEELVRLEAHLAACRQLLDEEGSIGKRLEFLFQELHREFNTIASKSADLEVTRHTIAARGEIEKLKEQVQNVE